MNLRWVLVLVIATLFALQLRPAPAGADDSTFEGPDVEAWNQLREVWEVRTFVWEPIDGIPWMYSHADKPPMTIMWDNRERQWYAVTNDYGLPPREMYDLVNQHCSRTAAEDPFFPAGCVAGPRSMNELYEAFDKVSGFVERFKTRMNVAKEMLDLIESLNNDAGLAGYAWTQVYVDDMKFWPANIDRETFVSDMVFDNETWDKSAETLQWLYTRMVQQGIGADTEVMQRVRSMADEMGVELIMLTTVEEVFADTPTPTATPELDLTPPDTTPTPSTPTPTLSPPTPTATPVPTLAWQPTVTNTPTETAQQRADRIVAEYRRIFPIWIKAESAKVAEITQVYGEQIVIEANAVPLNANSYRVKWYGWRLVNGKQQIMRSANVSASVDELASWTEMHKADLKKWGIPY